MKCFVALVALVAAVSAESNIINPWTQATPYGFSGFNGAINPFVNQFGARPFATPFTGFNRGIVPYGVSPFQQRRVFKREAESDSESFYPGFPFAPITPYGANFNPYFSGYQRPAVNPYHYGQPQVYATHPFMYNPVLKTVEEKQPVAHTVEKRESESDSFYPGFPYVHPSVAHTPYYGQPQLPFYNTYNSPVMAPQAPVLPYAFNGYYNRPIVRVVKPVEQEVESQ